MQKIVLVVPCYNEAKRLNQSEFLRLASGSNALLFVNDGSKDSTLTVLKDLAARSPKIKVLDMPKNGGKAEAVRAGMLEAMKDGANLVGYVDADLATPVDEINRLVETALSTKNKIILGSRIRLLGTNIQRKPLRHYLGRVFATTVSLGLSLRVYDTQCGAKIFNTTEGLKKVLSKPFISRWIFDVELLGRLLKQEKLKESDFLEVPLREWIDVDGSKLTFKAMLGAWLDLLSIIWKFRMSKD